MSFVSDIKHTASCFDNTVGDVSVIAHNDADGITSAAIISQMLSGLGRSFEIRFTPLLTAEDYSDLKTDVLFFLDTGTSHAKDLGKVRIPVFILDHHRGNPMIPDNVHIVNPSLHREDGSRVISAAGIAYLFCEAVIGRCNLAHLAVIGAIGDLQHKKGFMSYNDRILKDALGSGTLRAENGLVAYTGTRSLMRHLSTNEVPFIDGITGSIEKTRDFLDGLKIPEKTGKSWTRWDDLDRVKKKLLIEELEARSRDEVIGKRYVLTDPSLPDSIKDARIFSTMLNGCGRMGDPKIGLMACTYNKHALDTGIADLRAYRQEIMEAICWYESSEKIIRKNNVIIIDATKDIRPSIVGPLTSVISRSRASEGTYVLSFSDFKEKIKVSLRFAGEPARNLSEVLGDLIEGCNGTSGGHRNAAGALIDIKDKDKISLHAERLI